jgi:hypothetical protein
LVPVAELANPVNRPGMRWPWVPIRPNSPTLSSCGLQPIPSTAATGISHVSLLRGRLGSRSAAWLVLLLSLPEDTNLSWAMSSA